MISDSAKRAWLKELYPGYFSLSMATGIISIALAMLKMTLLAEGLYVLTLCSWCTLLFLYTWRLARFPKVVWEELFNPRTTFFFFSFVASTNIAGMLLYDHAQVNLAIICWLGALAAWLVLLHCSFSVLTLRHGERKVSIVHGGWLMSIVGTQSLVLHGLNVVPHLGRYADHMMVALYMLWGIGLCLYGIFVTLFCYRIFFLDMSDSDYTPLMWVIMGAAAISANASSALALSSPAMSVLAAFHPIADLIALVSWAWATWWIPLLVVMGYWKHFMRGAPLRYEPTQWSIVFPLGMYAVTSFRLALAAEFEPLHWVSHIMLWIAFAAWGLVMLGLLRRLTERRGAELSP